MSALVGSQCLLNTTGGVGMLVLGCARREAEQVVVIGGGTAGYNAAQMATACAPVTVLDVNAVRLVQLIRSSVAASPPSHRPTTRFVTRSPTPT
jgi:alanine dehydrogenase